MMRNKNMNNVDLMAEERALCQELDPDGDIDSESSGSFADEYEIAAMMGANLK